MKKKVIRIATRKSPMATWQAHFIAQKLQQHHADLAIEFLGLTTEGDRNLEKPLTEVGGKSLFVKELQQALLEDKADIAVHCIKDMSVIPCPGLILAAITERADPRDAFISKKYTHFAKLPLNAIVGSSSPRRQAQLLALRPDLTIKPLRGNVGSRLSKMEKGEYDAIVLAAAGLKRLNEENKINHYFSLDEMLPCIGQGALGIECREQDQSVVSLIKFLNHPPSELCVQAERAVNRKLGGDCYTPIAAYACLSADQTQVTLSALVASLNGKKILTCVMQDDINNANYLGVKVAEDLLAQGAKELLEIASGNF